MDKIAFRADDGTILELYIEEQTTIGGITYLLASDSQGEDGNAYILKDVSESDSEEAVYVMPEDDSELEAVYAVFREMMDDVDLI